MNTRKPPTSLLRSAAMKHTPTLASLRKREKCFAKFIRKHDGIEPSNAANWETFKADLENYRKELKKELGDVLWMVAAIATLNNFDLAGVMQENIAKLQDRLNRGVIIGEGDNR